MTESKLKNCPFCGGGPEHHVNLCARIVCKKCKARTDGHLEHSNAMAHWNARVPDPTKQALIDALKKIIFLNKDNPYDQCKLSVRMADIAEAALKGVGDGK